MFKKLDGIDVEAALYVFHDPPVEGKRMMRATTAAYLLPTGELFIGCSCASEGDASESASTAETAAGRPCPWPPNPAGKGAENSPSAMSSATLSAG